MARKFDRMPDLPKTVNDPKVEEFMEHYYAMSNAPNNKESDDEFIGMFTKDGQYCFNHKVATGHAEIAGLREELFAGIPTRDHFPLQFFTHGHDQMQLMARGKATHGHHSGNEEDINYASYYELAKVDGQIKFKKIHILAT